MSADRTNLENMPMAHYIVGDSEDTCPFREYYDYCLSNHTMAIMLSQLEKRVAALERQRTNRQTGWIDDRPQSTAGAQMGFRSTGSRSNSPHTTGD